MEGSGFTNVDLSVASAYKVDVIHPEELETAVDKVVSEFNGRLDVFIANSGTACTYIPSPSRQKSSPGTQRIKIFPPLCFASRG